jgi:hypothetical protein
MVKLTPPRESEIRQQSKSPLSHAEMLKAPLYRANFLHLGNEMAQQIFDAVPQRRRR